ncbi:unnamed protein product [Pieris macdunnoughi]|uniref:Uncharacterized protein n=1 Tax=Pieris macdunnoughi TaxID=345717 RepID=A0A821M505_9NEOP|nr:unnamed protein product [Pieris macdunnoughi]
MKSLVFCFLFVCAKSQDTQNDLRNLPVIGEAGEVLDNLINQIDNGEDEIERPCKSLDNHCVRNWLHEHSSCKKTFGSVPDPLHRVQATQQLPRINLTMSAIDVSYNGLNGRIEEFYVNRKTDQVVLAVEFRNVVLQTNNSYYIFYRRAKEPVVTNDFYIVRLSSLIVTATIPRIDNLRYDRSEHFTYSNDPTSTFIVGPTSFAHRDPVVQRVFLALISNLPINVREIVISEGPFLMANFIQYSLCDFGIKVI